MLLAQANAFYSFKSILIHSSGGLHTGVGKRRATGHSMVDKRAVQEMWSKRGHLVSTNAFFRAARCCCYDCNKTRALVFRKIDELLQLHAILSGIVLVAHKHLSRYPSLPVSGCEAERERSLEFVDCVECLTASFCDSDIA
jgi:hypothetical protein